MTAPRAAVPGPGFIALEGPGSRVEVVPSHGGRIRALVLGGRDWLVRPAADAAPRAEASVLAGAGWDECAPAAAAGTVPEWVKGYGGRAIPAGGEARLQVPSIELRTGADGHRLRCTWRGERLPWTLERTLHLRADGTLEVRYEATNIGEQRLPFLWSACLVMPLDGTTRLKLPDAARLRVQSVTGADGAAVLGGTHQWPRLTLEGRSRDLATPWELPRRASVHAWVDLGRARSQVQVRQGAQALTIGVDGAGGLHCGLLLDRGAARSGVRGGLLSRRVPALVLQPSLGAPDRLADALGDWQAVAWLTPGEVRQWSLTLKVGSGP